MKKFKILNFKFQNLKTLFRTFNLSTDYYLLPTKPRAFTLIEALIVMLILASSMTAALYLLTTVVFSTQKNLARTKAIYLAQECTELTRNIRDTAWRNYQAWDCAFGAPGDEFIVSHAPGGGSIANCNNQNFAVTWQALTSPEQARLYQASARINHDSSTGVPTPYRRSVQHVLNHDTSGDGRADTIELNCRVEWEFNGRPQQVTTAQTLTNWRRN